MRCGIAKTVAYTHQAKTLLGRELSDGIALDGVVSEIEFCDHIVLVSLYIYSSASTTFNPCFAAVASRRADRCVSLS